MTNLHSHLNTFIIHSEILHKLLWWVISRPGDYTIEGNFTDKQILPNMLRVVMARRQGEVTSER